MLSPPFHGLNQIRVTRWIPILFISAYSKLHEARQYDIRMFGQDASWDVLGFPIPPASMMTGDSTFRGAPIVMLLISARRTDRIHWEHKISLSFSAHTALACTKTSCFSVANNIKSAIPASAIQLE
jgi:hypothetical protein